MFVPPIWMKYRKLRQDAMSAHNHSHTDKREQTAGGCKSECVMRHVKVTEARRGVCVCVWEDRLLLNSQITRKLTFYHRLTLIMLGICSLYRAIPQCLLVIWRSYLFNLKRLLSLASDKAAGWPLTWRFALIGVEMER